ncbi:MAG: hypothetical protein JSS66_16735 [Armatimonadetes bacterium]|nr:hypothetical protein [Armatimonadota bacterium]
MIGAAVLSLLRLAAPADPGTALHDYISSPDQSFSWKEAKYGAHTCLKMRSQTWHGNPWDHDVVICSPKGKSDHKTWVLHITGADPNAFDVDWSQHLADTSGCPVAILFQIPVQPLWDKKEDDLIAHTFEQYLATGDETWPLLLPMVKSAVRAMDAVQEYDKRARKFVPFGASKRGWTSWLTAATQDKRVVGVAPMLFDNLNMPAQLHKQLTDWGEFSPMIKDYTNRNLEDTVDSPEGKRLVQIVDPYSYLDRINVPIMTINGANDPYWTTDASSLYWDKIKGPKWSVTVPNLGHAFEKTEWWTPSLAAFVKMCSAGAAKEWAKLKPLKTEEWSATSKDRHFADKEWRSTGKGASGDWRASFRATRTAWHSIEFWLTSAPTVAKIP